MLKINFFKLYRYFLLDKVDRKTTFSKSFDSYFFCYSLQKKLLNTLSYLLRMYHFRNNSVVKKVRIPYLNLITLKGRKKDTLQKVL